VLKVLLAFVSLQKWDRNFIRRHFNQVADVRTDWQIAAFLRRLAKQVTAATESAVIWFHISRVAPVSQCMAAA
jgi:hypothetical protein